jgi:hypothetical protein
MTSDRSLMQWPESLEFLADLAGSELLVRVARETAEDDLGIESIDGDTFRGLEGSAILRSAINSSSTPVSYHSPSAGALGEHRRI